MNIEIDKVYNMDCLDLMREMAKFGAELDKEYFALGQKRLQEEQNQISMFDL